MKSLARSVLLATAVAFPLVASACLPEASGGSESDASAGGAAAGGGFGGGTGGSGGSGGGTGGTGAVPIDGGTALGMTPPANLNLDGSSITSGLFTLEEVTAYSFSGSTAVPTELLGAKDAPIVKDATIGSSSYFTLVMIPSGTEVLHMSGFFDATYPDLPPAQFDLTVFGDLSKPMDFTIFLPLQTSLVAYQFTGVGSDAKLGDNVDAFCSTPIAPASYAQVKQAGGSSGVIDPTQAPLTCASPSISAQMQMHGTGSGLSICETPPDCSGQFCCGFADASGCITDMHCDGIECFNYDEVPCS